jgi:hypothetical protein
MKTIVLLTTLFLGAVCAGSAGALDIEPDRDIAQITTTMTIPAGSGDVEATALTVPSSRRLVIKTVSFYKYGGPAGSSSAEISIGTTLNGQQNYWTSAAVTDNGLPYPGATMAATFYAGAGTPVLLNAFRTGDTTNPDVIVVSISGYYISNR